MAKLGICKRVAAATITAGLLTAGVTMAAGPADASTGYATAGSCRINGQNSESATIYGNSAYGRTYSGCPQVSLKLRLKKDNVWQTKTYWEGDGDVSGNVFMGYGGDLAYTNHDVLISGTWWGFTLWQN